MKKVKCAKEGCEHVRSHWFTPDKERGPQYIDVPDDYEGPAYCSLTCAMLDGAMSVRGDSSGGSQSILANLHSGGPDGDTSCTTSNTEAAS